MSENKRSAKRYDVIIPIEVTAGDLRKASEIRNISLGGVYVAPTPEKMTLGQKVHLRFSVPTQKEPVEVGGQVRWVDQGGFGVQFDGLRARDVWALGKYFESLPAH